MTMTTRRTSLLATAFAVAATMMFGSVQDASAQQPQRQQLRFGTAAIGGDLPVEMMYVFKEWVDRSAPGEFDVQVHHTGTLVRQGTEITALQRNSVEMSILSWWDIGDRIPEFNVMTVGYLFKDWNHVKAAMDGDIGKEYKARIARDLQIEILDYYYAGPRIVNLREARKVSRRTTRYTLLANFVRKLASSIAESPPPTTAISCPRKKKPSHVAHVDTPWPMSSFSRGRSSINDCAPVATMMESALYSVSRIHTLNGRDEKSTFVTFSVMNSAPKRSA
jgi:hypothetical protein